MQSSEAYKFNPGNSEELNPVSKWENNVVQFPEKVKSFEDQGEEVKDNVVDFPVPETPKLPRAGTHEMSEYILKHDLKFNNIGELDARYKQLLAEKDQVVMTLVQKIHDKVFNHGQETKRITDLEHEINDLARFRKTYNTTLSPENPDAVETPQNLWPPAEMPKPEVPPAPPEEDHKQAA